jgi:inorganic pyrophosphatase
MNIWHDIDDARIKADDFVVIVEISKGSKKKYEIDKVTGLIELVRILSTSTHYPSNYGFIPRTLSQDGDPLDVLVLCSESLDPMTLVRCYPIGVVEMTDGGFLDEKIIAIPFKDPYFNEYTDTKKLPNHMSQEIVHFLSVYKALEDQVTEVKPVESRAKAIQVIKKAKIAYTKKFGSDCK